MTYHYEALNDVSFQKLAQSLIVSVHPDAICLPVRQPDGGRDAILYRAALERGNFIVFQIKFSYNPTSSTERQKIAETIRTEQGKVNTLIAQGASHYYLVTNIQGTARLNTGSIDQVNAMLTDAFNIPSYVWWRDDLNARLDNASDIKWSYPEICKASDILQLLIGRTSSQTSSEPTRAIRAYMARQYGDDRDVKFKQVELKKKLTELFTDIPIGHKGSLRESLTSRRSIYDDGDLSNHLEQLDEDFDLEFEELHPFPHNGLAAAFLLHMPFGTGVTRLVLEGAPGQGKSTVTQFMCQVNRLRLLQPQNSDLSSVDHTHVSGPTRTPFRIDLRDFAAWVAGRHPYANANDALPPSEAERSLEAFLTMQISYLSGGLQLTHNDLFDFLARAHSLVVLDGFDEVADISLRAKVVEEVCAAANRLDAHALSLQIVVTSRPAAFVNSPGFPEEDWAHLELKDLKLSHITAYKEKWSEAQDLTSTEKRSLTSTLEDKLQQPHLRDLSRNPMQLAILLQLMHVQGSALPDKRTALYDEYMKIFLNREVEKKQIAADQRELILSVHGLLAWLLQVQAETGQGSGSITMEALRTEVNHYLIREEYDPDLARTLLAGTVERVGALVSRVQGTFEFEVQPLREYFAARHLHKTAPYSPPGSIRRGTRPDRFGALASSSYWTNVTRFFSGFYDVGELPSLVDGLCELDERPGFNLLSLSRRLSIMLLGDYVFAQSPRSIRRLINFVTEGPGFERLLAVSFSQNQASIALPQSAGGKALVQICESMLEEQRDSVLRSGLWEVMVENGDTHKVKEFWLQQLRSGLETGQLLSEVVELGLVEAFTPEDIELVANGDSAIKVRWLTAAGRYDVLLDDPVLSEAALAEFFALNVSFPASRSARGPEANRLVALSMVLNPHVFLECYAPRSEQALGFNRWDAYRRGLSRYVKRSTREPKQDTIDRFAARIDQVMETPREVWRSSLQPWDDLVNEGFQVAPCSRRFVLLAMLSTGVSSNCPEDVHQSEWSDAGFLRVRVLSDDYILRDSKVMTNSGGGTSWKPLPVRKQLHFLPHWLVGVRRMLFLAFLEK